jgi:hypothetical protein
VTRLSIFGYCICACGIAASLLAASESSPPDGSAARLTRQEVWSAVAAALRERGISEQSLLRIEELDLPGGLSALAGTGLRVTSACWDAATQRTQFRLECAEATQCLPFLAYVREVRNDIRDSGNLEEARFGSCRLGSRTRPVLTPFLKPAIRAGDRATAVFISDRLRMAASVTCLERGREGEVIRVRGLDGHIFRARISGPALLEVLPQ